MFDSFALRQLGISAVAAFALALSACGGGGPAAELAAAPAPEGGGSSPVEEQAAAPAPEGGGSSPVEEQAAAPASEGGGSPPMEEQAAAPASEGGGSPPVEEQAAAPVSEGGGIPPVARAFTVAPAPPGGESRSSSAAAWHAFGAAGTGPNGAALVTAGDLASIGTEALDYASDYGPSISVRWDAENIDWNSISQTDGLKARLTANHLTTLRIGHNGAGQVSYGLAYSEERSARPARVWSPASPAYAWGWTFDSETAGTNVRRVSSDGGQGALFRRETDAGNLWAAVATDISGPGDTDWLATGVWAYAPAEPSSDQSRGYRFGVFAGGGEPYGGNLDSDARASLVKGLTGTAKYEGGAAGVWSRLTGATEATRRNDLFSADAALTIDFSDDPEIGPVARAEGVAIGRIHNMKIGGTPIAGNPEIALSGGRVSGSRHRQGFIGGAGSAATSMTFGGAAFDGAPGSWTGDGSWGAGLFGSPASGAAGADRLPGAVAGTFGVGSGVRGGGWGRRPDGDYVIGAFAAHRTAWTDTPGGGGAPAGEGPGEGGPAAPGGGSASPSGTAWHVFGEAGTGPTGAALVTAEDLSGIYGQALTDAAVSGPAFGSAPHLSQSGAWHARRTWESMGVRIGHNDAGQVTYRLNYGEEEGHIEGVATHPWSFDSEAEGTNVRRWSSGGRKGALFRREDPAGNLWAAVSTDVSGSGDTDWLAAGVWAYTPAGGPSYPSYWHSYREHSGGVRFGVFAGGGDPVSASSVAARSGGATYEGDAAGVYSRRTERTLSRRNGRVEWTRRNDFFTADATLTVDFSSDTATGRIHDIAIDGTPIAGNPEINLPGGRLRASESGRAIVRPGSRANMTFDGRNWSGDWGAAFFGNGASSVAGTFGVRYHPLPHELHTDYFIGVFGAHRTAQTDAP